ncbi:DUF5988 family protein [Phytohabitans houttuyneae]|jgi:hypothetical protein|uniref:Uncharacterized protein n=1 Tax=Phytohabitans houttuyneae TaxID=1076126 RepID=A0A6V8K6H5_9ACTN|nr:DUF5988 family protein [Phytohabitans houttuyneae]GFJ80802.1 hypothetical protein Phou_049820 [Phytohabitans houttuyneae]
MIDTPDAMSNGDDRVIIQVVLEGGPATLPSELRTHRVASVDDKVKVPHQGGYEHFEYEGAAGDRTVYRWTGRTRVAE